MLFALTLTLALPASLNTISALDGNAQAGTTSGLASWNPNVACTADLVTFPDVLGSAYPSQSLSGSRYQRNSTAGGVPHPRALSPPCMITNGNGEAVTSFVQIEGAYLAEYIYQPYDCSNHYKGVNGGGPYPNNETICEWQGTMYAMGTADGFMQIEFDQDWMAKRYCGPGVSYCDNATIARYVSSGTVSLDFQGFVYWDGENWELHPLTSWRVSDSSPPPPPPSNAPPTADFTWTPSTGDNSTVFSFTATASDDHDSPDAIQIRWDWQGDGTWDTQWSTTKTAQHQYRTAGNKTVILAAMDSGGLTSTKSHVVRVTASPPPPPPPPPPPSNAPPTVDFSWTPASGDTSTVFSFTASASDDQDAPSAIQIRWDWNGDGTWDTGWSTTKSADHSYDSPGDYAAAVQALDSGGLTATTSHVVQVSAPPPPPPPPPPDFRVGAAPGSLTIVIGSSATSTITLTSLNGLAGTATLSVSISSSDLILIWPTCSVSPGSLTLSADGTASSTLTVSTSLLTTPGTYTVTVTANVGSITQSVDVTVVVKLF